MNWNYWRTYCRQRFSIRGQLLMLVLALSVLSSFVYMYYGYRRNTEALLQGLDARLELAGRAADQRVAKGYFDRCDPSRAQTIESVTAQPPDAETAEFFRQLQELDDNADLQYLYAVMQDDEGRYFFPFGTSAGYCTYYDDPAEDIVSTLEDGLLRATILDDPEYGRSRSVILRRQTPSGKYYVLGADMRLTEVEAVQDKVLRDFLQISVLLCVLMATFSCLSAYRLSRPIERLSEFTVGLRRSEFSRDEPMPPGLLPADPDKARSEISRLALNIDLFRHALAEAVQKKERAESELRIAGEIQLSSLPKALDDASLFDIAGELKPALEAGGDLYDYRILDGRLYFAIGDVCGKGMPAALFMAMTLTLMRSAVRRDFTPAEIVRFVNDNLAENNEQCTFVTLLCGIFDAATGEVAYCNAGNCPPLVLAPGATPQYEPLPKEPPVGVMPGLAYATHTLTLAPGAALVLYTDGITEAAAADESFFGTERLRQTAAAIPPNADAHVIFDRILGEVTEFTAGAPQSDDITLLVIRRPE